MIESSPKLGEVPSSVGRPSGREAAAAAAASTTTASAANSNAAAAPRIRQVVDRDAMERGDLFPGMISREIDVPYVKIDIPFFDF